jgi:hypothetical protein
MPTRTKKKNRTLYTGLMNRMIRSNNRKIRYKIMRMKISII